MRVESYFGTVFLAEYPIHNHPFYTKMKNIMCATKKILSELVDVDPNLDYAGQAL